MKKCVASSSWTGRGQDDRADGLDAATVKPDGFFGSAPGRRPISQISVSDFRTGGFRGPSAAWIEEERP